MNASNRSSRSGFASLFDFSSPSFTTPATLKVLYILALINMVLATIVTIGLVAQFGSTVLVISLLNVLIYAIAARILIDGILALIRTYENTRILAENVLTNPPNRSNQP